MQKKLRDRSRRGGIAKAVAILALGAVIGVGSVVSPTQPPPKAQASWAKEVDPWAKAMGTSLSSAAKVFAFEKSPASLAAVGAIAFVGPLLSALFGGDSGPTIQDVLDKLDDIENRLDDIEADLEVVSQQIDNVDADVLLGTCEVETAALTDLLSEVETAQMAYQEVIEATRNVEDEADARYLQRVSSAFVETVFGAGQSSQILVGSTSLGRALTNAHDRLVTTPGSVGVIDTCGKAFHKQWMNEQPESVADTEAGAWMDDRSYYEPVQDLVRYWQTVQAQGLTMLQQAAYLQAIVGYHLDGNVLSPDDADQACASVAKDSAAHGLCASAKSFSDTFFDRALDQWRQVGAPYSNDEVVLALGTSLNGLSGEDGTLSTLLLARDLWAVAARAHPVDPTESSDGDNYYADVEYDGFGEWRTPSSSDWQNLSAGYVASHPDAPNPGAGWGTIDAVDNLTDASDQPYFPVSEAFNPNPVFDRDDSLRQIRLMGQPVGTVPTDGSCTTNWGVLSRCGEQFDTWATQNIPTTRIASPEAMAAPTVAAGDQPERAVCEAPAWETSTGAVSGGEIEYGEVSWTAVASGGQSMIVSKAWGEELSITEDVIPGASWSEDPATFAVSCLVSASFAGEANVAAYPSEASPVSRVDGSWQVGVQAPTEVTESPKAGVVADGDTPTLSATFAVPSDPDAASVGTDTDPGDGAGTEVPPGEDSSDSGSGSGSEPQETPSTSPSDLPEALRGGGGGHGAAAGMVSMTRLAESTQPYIVWEKRVAGTDAWVPVDGGGLHTSNGSEQGVPHAVARDTVHTEVTLAEVTAAHHGDQYRATYIDENGTHVVSEITTVQVASVVKPWLSGVVAAATMAFLVGVMFVAMAIRKRRAVKKAL